MRLHASTARRPAARGRNFLSTATVPCRRIENRKRRGNNRGNEKDALGYQENGCHASLPRLLASSSACSSSPHHRLYVCLYELRGTGCRTAGDVTRRAARQERRRRLAGVLSPASRSGAAGLAMRLADEGNIFVALTAAQTYRRRRTFWRRRAADSSSAAANKRLRLFTRGRRISLRRAYYCAPYISARRMPGMGALLSRQCAYLPAHLLSETAVMARRFEATVVGIVASHSREQLPAAVYRPLFCGAYAASRQASSISTRLHHLRPARCPMPPVDICWCAAC